MPFPVISQGTFSLESLVKWYVTTMLNLELIHVYNCLYPHFHANLIYNHCYAKRLCVFLPLSLISSKPNSFSKKKKKKKKKISKPNSMTALLSKSGSLQLSVSIQVVREIWFHFFLGLSLSKYSITVFFGRVRQTSFAYLGYFNT